MNISTLMMAMLVLSGVMLGAIAYYGDIITVYSPANSTSTEQFQKFNSSFYNYSTMITNLENKTASFSISNPESWGDGGLAFLSVAGIILQTPQLFINTIKLMTESVAIAWPNWLLPLIISAITIFVVMKIASIFIRRYGGDI